MRGNIFERKYLFLEKKYLFMIMAVFLFLLFGGGILAFQLIILSKQNFRWSASQGKVEKRELIGKSIPTLIVPTSTITPTPTLTPQQIVEIQREKFVEWNQKYGPCQWVPILMYHHVMDPTAAKEILATNLNVPPNTFREQMDYLLGKSYNVIGLDEMLVDIKNNSLPPKPIVLTFDDGYRDFYDNVFPVLKEKNFKATLFVISQFVGGERYLYWWQIQKMADSGLILIGDHTLNHQSLPKLSIEEVTNQIVSAAHVIEERVGRKVDFFAYPYGSYNSDVLKILKENGFAGAVVTTNINPQCALLPYELSRIRIGAGSLSQYGL